MTGKPSSVCRTFAVLALAGVVVLFGGPARCGEVEQDMSPTMQRLAELVAKAKPAETDAVISGFIQEHKGQFPIIEDSLVTFVYRGRVALRATVPSDLNGWDTKADEMKRLDNTDLHYLTLKLPRDARLDYKFYVDGMWMMDPLNEATVTGGFGPNSAFAMPDYVEAPEIEYVDSLAHGMLEGHDFNSSIIAGKRRIQVYLPHGYDGSHPGGYRVIFVQDGGDYIKLGSMVNVLDYVIAHRLVPPLVAVFIDPLDRNYEYFLNKDYERMMIEEIVPFVRERYNVSEDADKNAVMGASLGGAISVMIALDDPETFGKCGSQSGAFEIKDGALIERVSAEPLKAVDFYLDCGTFEDLIEENRLMRQALEDKGYRVMYHEFDEGHSWGNWRAHIDDMLVFFWGGSK